MKQKVLKGLKIVTRWLACAKSALVLGVIVALITWGMPLATPQFVAKVRCFFDVFVSYLFCRNIYISTAGLYSSLHK